MKPTYLSSWSTRCSPSFSSSAHTSRLRGIARTQVLAKVVEREPRVDDVLDDQDVAAGQVDVEVLDDPHHTAGLGGRPVGGDRHEVDLDGQLDGPHQVRHEVDRTLQHADQQRRIRGVVLGDLGVRARATRSRTSLADTTTSPRSCAAHGGEIVRRWLSMAAQRSGVGYSSVSRWSRRARRRPPLSSVATTSPRTTAIARSTSSALGGWVPSPWSATGAVRTRSHRRSRAVGPVAQLPAVRVLEGRATRHRDSRASSHARSSCISPRLTREEGHHVAPGHVAHQGHQLVADPVATEVRRSRWSRRTGARTAMVATKSCSAPRRTSRSGLVGSSTIGDEPVETGPAQHVQQHRLGEVVHRVAGHDPGGQGRAARGTRARASKFGPGSTFTS